MTRRGSALLTALWFLVVASGLALSTIAGARLGLEVSTNRMGLRRGHWADEACLALLEADYREHKRLVGLDSVDLGDGVWCRATVDDPSARLNVNVADVEQLGALFGADSIAGAIIDWIDPDDRPTWDGAERDWYQPRGRRPPRNGPLTDLDELLDVRGVTPELLASVRPFLTTRSAGRINVNAAAAPVLALLPGMDPAYAAGIVSARRRGQLFSGLDELLARAPPETKAAMLDSYSDLIRVAVFGAERYVVSLEGFDRGGPPADETLTVVPTAGRLAVTRKEVW